MPYHLAKGQLNVSINIIIIQHKLYYVNMEKIRPQYRKISLEKISLYDPTIIEISGAKNPVPPPHNIEK